MKIKAVQGYGHNQSKELSTAEKLMWLVENCEMLKIFKLLSNNYQIEFKLGVENYNFMKSTKPKAINAAYDWVVTLDKINRFGR